MTGMFKGHGRGIMEGGGGVKREKTYYLREVMRNVYVFLFMPFLLNFVGSDT